MTDCEYNRRISGSFTGEPVELSSNDKFKSEREEVIKAISEFEREQSVMDDLQSIKAVALYMKSKYTKDRAMPLSTDLLKEDFMYLLDMIV